jgi:hypothetical protein
VPKPPPESTKTSLRQRLTHHAQTHWPALDAVSVRYRGVFAYVDGLLPGGGSLPLCRLRYHGSAGVWGFAIYLASRDGYQDSVLPSGLPAGSRRKPSTAAAACTSTIPAPGCNPRRINGEDHIAPQARLCSSLARQRGNDLLRDRHAGVPEGWRSAAVHSSAHDSAPEYYQTSLGRQRSTHRTEE